MDLETKHEDSVKSVGSRIFENSPELKKMLELAEQSGTGECVADSINQLTEDIVESLPFPVPNLVSNQVNYVSSKLEFAICTLTGVLVVIESVLEPQIEENLGIRIPDITAYVTAIAIPLIYSVISNSHKGVEGSEIAKKILKSTSRSDVAIMYALEAGSYYGIAKIPIIRKTILWLITMKKDNT